MQQRWGQITTRVNREGRRKGKEIDVQPTCGPLQLFSRGCAYGSTMGEYRGIVWLILYSLGRETPIPFQYGGLGEFAPEIF